MDALFQALKRKVTQQSWCKYKQYNLIYFYNRNPLNKNQNEFKTIPYDGVDNLWSIFTHQVKRQPDANFLGSRDPTQDGAPYVWKTWAKVNEIVDDLAAGYQKLNLLPEIEGDGKMWRFMGIYAKNREEWVFSDYATIRQKGTTIAFYDTLGPK